MSGVFDFEKKWKLKDIDLKNINKLNEIFHFPEIVIKTLFSRGIDTEEKIDSYINSHLYSLYSPFYFRDMEKAVLRILEAIEKKELILIFGDRDVDGVTATAIVYRFLSRLGANVVYRVPEGQDNYGLTREIIDWAILNEISLIITVDCGITNIEEVDKAKNFNIDIIVTDHHEPREELPKAYAIINPKLKDDFYPFPSLSGSSVALKLVLGIAEKLYLKEYHNEEIVFFDLETTGLNPVKDEIIEIGAVKVKNGVVIDSFEALVKPSKPVSPEIESITGISNQLLEKEGKPIEIVIGEFIKFIGDKKLVAHNLLEFDLKFLEICLKRISLPPLKNPLEDTLKMSRTMLKNCKDHKLNTVARTLGIYIDVKKLHRGLCDSEICAEIYRRLTIYRNQRYLELIEENLFYAAIGTIADIMPIVDENRVIVKNGIKYIKRAPVGVLTLIRELRIDLDNIKSRDLSFYVSPVINSPGRLGDASLSVELLISNKINEVEELVKDVLKKNGERKDIVENSIENIAIQIEKEDIEEKKILIFSSKEFTKGTIGLIASKFCNLYRLPVVVIAIDNDLAIGSIRATNGFDVPKFLETLKSYFTQFGGHKYAGGFVTKMEYLERLKEEIEKYADSLDYEENNEIDFEVINLEEFNMNAMKYLENVLQPTGYKNQMPVVLIKDVVVKNPKEIGRKQEHLSFAVMKDGISINVIGWKFFEKLRDKLDEGKKYDLVVRPEINTFNNEEEVRLILLDIRTVS
ncbi:MAG: single-stranded-DNA-specific exonuclease RecJ [Brevinematia bacterium]